MKKRISTNVVLIWKVALQYMYQWVLFSWMLFVKTVHFSYVFYCNQVLYSQHSIFFVTYESAQLARLFHNTKLEMLTSEKHSNLLGQLQSCKENEVLWIRTLNVWLYLVDIDPGGKGIINVVSPFPLLFNLFRTQPRAS